MQIYGIFTENQGKYVKNRGKRVENSGISVEFIPRDGRTKGRSCGRFRSFPVVSGRFCGYSRRKSENIGENREYQRISEKSFRFLSFSFHFITLSFLIIPNFTPILCSKTYFLQILLKFLAFFLAVPNILRTFANGYKTIVNYPARRPLSPMASGRRLFLCLGKSFFLTGKIIFPNWENRYAQYMAAA